MPIAIAVVGIFGTFILSWYQTERAEISKQAEIESSEKLARAQQQVKILEIFAEKIMSENENERKFAVRILKTVEPDLAEKLAQAVIEIEPPDSPVRKTAEDLLKELAEEITLAEALAYKDGNYRLLLRLDKGRHRILEYVAFEELVETEKLLKVPGSYLLKEKVSGEKIKVPSVELGLKGGVYQIMIPDVNITHTKQYTIEILPLPFIRPKRIAFRHDIDLDKWEKRKR